MDAGPWLPQVVKAEGEEDAYFYGRAVREQPDADVASRVQAPQKLPPADVYRERAGPSAYWQQGAVSPAAAEAPWPNPQEAEGPAPSPGESPRSLLQQQPQAVPKLRPAPHVVPARPKFKWVAKQPELAAGPAEEPVEAAPAQAAQPAEAAPAQAEQEQAWRGGSWRGGAWQQADWHQAWWEASAWSFQPWQTNAWQWEQNWQGHD